MVKGRLEAFSDGVFAIIITILVLELKAPTKPELDTLVPLISTLLCYLLSFLFIGIYWNNHHHTFQAVQHVNGRVLWANLHLLFWLSLIPFVTGWMGNTDFSPWPTAAYGFVLLMSAVAYTIMTSTLVRQQGKESTLSRALGKNLKGNISLLLYCTAIPAALVAPWVACGLYVIVALIWLVPDPRIERRMNDGG